MCMCFVLASVADWDTLALSNVGLWLAVFKITAIYQRVLYFKAYCAQVPTTQATGNPSGRAAAHQEWACVCEWGLFPQIGLSECGSKCTHILIGNFAAWAQRSVENLQDHSKTQYKYSHTFSAVWLRSSAVRLEYILYCETGSEFMIRCWKNTEASGVTMWNSSVTHTHTHTHTHCWQHDQDWRQSCWK